MKSAVPLTGIMGAMEDEIVINIAGFLLKLKLHESKGINVRNMFIHQVKNTFKPFIMAPSSVKADIVLNVVEREKIMDKASVAKKGQMSAVLFRRKRGGNEIYYDLSTQQFQEVVRRLIFKGIYFKKGLILHCSSVIHQGRANLFIAPSGGGKTTILNLLRPHCQAFADDAVLVKKEADGYYCYQIPFADQHTIVEGGIKKIKLGTIYFIHKASVNQLIKVGKVEAANRLLSRSVREKRMVKNALAFALEFDGFFDLYFSRQRDSGNLLQTLGGAAPGL